MHFSKKKILKTEIEKLFQLGLIRLEEKEKIEDYYHFDEENHFPLFSIFSALFFSFGLLILIAFNWENIPKLSRVLILFSFLLFSQWGIVYFKNKIYQNFFVVLNAFVLLGNLALISQMYHLGENASLLLISTAWVILFLFFALKNNLVFLESYFLAALGFLMAFPNDFYHSFLCFILLLFLFEKNNPLSFLRIFNFLFLCFYIVKSPCLLNFDFNAHFFNAFLFFLSYLSFLFLIWNIKNYKTCAYFSVSLVFLIFALESNGNILKDFGALPQFLFFLPFLICLFYQKIFWGVLGLVFTLKEMGLEEFFLENNEVILPGKLFYSILTLFWGIYLMKVGRKFLSIFVFFSLIFIRYVDLLGDYFGASCLFFIFAFVLFYFAKRK